MALREQLKQRNLTFAEVANRLDVSVPLISHWCSERVRISAERALELHREFGIPLHELRPDIWEGEG